jgi:hypothetical protein
VRFSVQPREGRVSYSQPWMERMAPKGFETLLPSFGTFSERLEGFFKADRSRARSLQKQRIPNDRKESAMEQDKGLGTWQFKIQDEALLVTLSLATTPEAVEQRRRLYHDYLAAVRTLRYLASKALLHPQDDAATQDAKRQALDRHLARLQDIQTLVIEPLFHPPSSLNAKTE